MSFEEALPPESPPPASPQEKPNLPKQSPVEESGRESIGGLAPRVSRLRVSFDLAPGEKVQFTIEFLPGQEPALRLEGTSQGQAAPIPLKAVVRGEVPAAAGAYSPSHAHSLFWQKTADWFTRLKDTARNRPVALTAVLFAVTLGAYLLTRLISLSSFPIFFFTDEAVQTVLASDLVRDGFRNYEGVLLPTYFQNGNYYNLSTSVYLQVLPYLLFGKSVFVTRVVSVLVSLLAAVSVGLILKNIFKESYWWSGILLLSIAPAWFLHSRTAFETVIFVSLYAATLYFYLLYRYRSPRYLYLTLVFSALAFYSYSPGQIVVAVTAVLFLFSDLSYHWKNRAVVLNGLGLLFLLALPYIRFRLTNHTGPIEHLRNLGSYWIQPLPFLEKLDRFIYEYSRGTSLYYWFVPNSIDLPRHIMKGYGHLMMITLPFAVLGLLICLKNIRSSAHRAVLVALLAAPVGSALVGVGITRLLVFVIPATLLTALGLSKFMVWLEDPVQTLQSPLGLKFIGWLKRDADPLETLKSASWLYKWKLPRPLLSASLLVFLLVVNFAMLRDALVHGPTWYGDYGLGGMQYGASQIFPAIREYLKQNPQAQIILSPSWSNGTDVVARFFLSDPLPIQMGSIEGYLNQKLPLSDDTVFIMIPDEYNKAAASGKLGDMRLEETLDYPNGQPGFFFVRTHYVDNIDEILASEREERRQLQEGEVTIDGETVPVRYSYLDMGDISLVFDGDPHSLARTWEANPFVIELDFPTSRQISGLSVIVGSLDVRVTVRLFGAGGESLGEFSTTYKGSVDHPEAFLDFDAPYAVSKLRVEVESIHEQEPAHVHIWEIIFR